MTFSNKVRKKNRNLLKRIKEEKLAVKQEQILYEKQKSAFIKQAIQNNKELLNKSRVAELKLSLSNTLAFTKEDNLAKFLPRGKTSGLLRNNSGILGANINQRIHKLDNLLVKTEKVTKNLYLEELKNKELEDRLRQLVN